MPHCQAALAKGHGQPMLSLETVRLRHLNSRSWLSQNTLLCRDKLYIDTTSPSTPVPTLLICVVTQVPKYQCIYISSTAFSPASFVNEDLNGGRPKSLCLQTPHLTKISYSWLPSLLLIASRAVPVLLHCSM